MNIADNVISMIKNSAIPMALYISGAGIKSPWGFAVGVANKDSRELLTIDTPFRIASNTKTFTAATILRLWEDGRLDLDTSITKYIDPKLSNLLNSAHCNADMITARHLLNHSSGLNDHADREYIIHILRNPHYIWTREEQVKRAISAPPNIRRVGESYNYSDTGYVLLGDIIERITNKPLALAVRQLLKLDHAQLTATWWEDMEPTPQNAQLRAQQYLGRHDTNNIHSSMDSFGGGGLIMSSRDLSRWMAMLFEGKIFKYPSTLAQMKSMGEHKNAEQYRLGLMYQRTEAGEVFSHTGFWGSAAYYSCEKNISVAGFTNICEQRPKLLEVIEDIIKLF